MRIEEAEKLVKILSLLYKVYGIDLMGKTEVVYFVEKPIEVRINFYFNRAYIERKILYYKEHRPFRLSRYELIHRGIHLCEVDFEHVRDEAFEVITLELENKTAREVLREIFQAMKNI